jgi:Conserved in the green lineage and diatoms 27
MVVSSMSPVSMESRTRCPVPKEQQPINEYRTLQDSWFFGWAKRPGIEFVKPIIGLWVLAIGVAGPVSAASFAPAKYPAAFAIIALAGALLLPLLALVQLYVGWIHIRDRLASPTVFYEESGWYDGQTWIKTPEIVAQDQLLLTYEVQPLLQRLQRWLLGLGLLLVLGFGLRPLF